MELTITKVADLFGVTERTVERWVQTRGLTANHINGQFRFNREQLLEWAAVNGVKLSPQLLGGTEHESRTAVCLADALAAGGIFHGIAGADKAAVLAAVVARLPLPSNSEKELLLQVLLAREELGSTGVGDGIAIPHPRNPIVLDVDRPLVTLSFLKTPIEFGAVDSIPVHTMFLVVTPSTRSHLNLISRLAYALHDDAFKDLLRRQAAPDAVLAAVRRIEAVIAGQPAP